LTWAGKAGKSEFKESKTVPAGSIYLLLQVGRYNSPTSQIPIKSLNIFFARRRVLN
jgi:hypothetical protein